MVFKTPLGGRRGEAVSLFRAVHIFVLLILFSGRLFAENDLTNKWWSAATESALAQAGTNRQELFAALGRVPAAQHDQLEFLIENAPPSDLRTLPAAYFLENITLADDAFDNAPWRDAIPPDIFLNEILPYACVNETRDGW